MLVLRLLIVCIVSVTQRQRYGPDTAALYRGARMAMSLVKAGLDLSINEKVSAAEYCVALDQSLTERRGVYYAGVCDCCHPGGFQAGWPQSHANQTCKSNTQMV